MAIFKKKHEFKPDKERSGALNKLYITKKQRRNIIKWLLMALALVLISIIQDVIMSRIAIFGTHTDLTACAILLLTIMLDPEAGSIFALTSSSLYYFSGSAPGPYVILMLTLLGVVIAIIRQSYLRYSFVSVFLCAAIGVLLYELLIFATGLFFGYTTLSRFTGFCITGGLSLVAIPILYPVFLAIGKFGGETWKE